MSHNIKYFEYKENVDRRKVQNELDRYVAYEDREEGCSGLNTPIRWIESGGILANYDEALEYIKSHDKGWYDCLAVRYRDFDGKDTPALKRAREKLSAAFEKYREFNNKFHFADSKSAYIGCRKCGSKISHQYLKGNSCPICGDDLRPQSTKDTIARYKANVDRATDLVKVEEKKAVEKNGKTMWLVKIEYHT
jgi:hypothetical protein